MAELHHLAPQDRAVLSLVVSKDKRFEEIATLLRIDPEVVRMRAHRAAQELAAAPETMRVGTRAALLDYILGQEAPSPEVRAELRQSAAAREWTVSLIQALGPLIRAPLPAPPTPPKAEVMPRVRPPAAVLLAAAIAAAVLVALVVILETGSTSGRRSSRTGSVPAAETIRRLALVPAGAGNHAVGAGRIVLRGGSLQLALSAKGLAPNRGDSYAVWLFNTRSDSRLLGFVSPPVGRAGTFSSEAFLPSDAIRFRLLVVTRETSGRPRLPGQAILRAPLGLS